MTLFYRQKFLGCLLSLYLSDATFSHSLSIALYSDLHLEQYTESERPTLTPGEADIIVLAGDIHNGPKAMEFAIALANDTAKPVIFIAGNHEYFGYNRQALQQQFKNMADAHKSVYFLENQSQVIEGIRFLGCTLWSDLSLFDNLAGQLHNKTNRLLSKENIRAHTQNNISDFHQIKSDTGLFTTNDMAILHNESVSWLQNELKVSHNGPTIVVTHFAPSPESYDGIQWQYSDKSLLFAPYFINDLTEVIRNHDIDYWFYGHTHSNIDYTMGNTVILSNQYTGTNGARHNPTFKPNWLLRLPPIAKQSTREK